MENGIIRGFSTTQPFYLPPHKRLPWMNGRTYLPALEEPEEELTVKREPPRQTWEELQKLKAYYIHLDKKLRTHIQASISKRKDNYIYSTFKENDTLDENSHTK